MCRDIGRSDGVSIEKRSRFLGDDEKKALETCGGNGCPTLVMYLVALNCILRRSVLWYV